MFTAFLIAAVTLGLGLFGRAAFVPGLGVVMMIVDIAVAGAIVHRRHGLEPVEAGKIGAAVYGIGLVAGTAVTLALQPVAIRLVQP